LALVVVLVLVLAQGSWVREWEEELSPHAAVEVQVGQVGQVDQVDQVGLAAQVGP
jgi:hypothetical protein